MAEEKKQEQTSYAERLAKAIQSLKGKPVSTGIDPEDPFKGNLPKGGLPDRFKKK